MATMGRISQTNCGCQAHLHDKNALQLPMGINNTVIRNGEFVGNGVLRLDANLEGINQDFDINQRNGLYIFSDNIELKGVLSSANGNNGAVLITPEYLLPPMISPNRLEQKLKLFVPVLIIMAILAFREVQMVILSIRVSQPIPTVKVM